MSMQYEEIVENKQQKQDVVKAVKKEKKKHVVLSGEKHHSRKKEEFDPDWVATNSEKDQNKLYEDALKHQQASKVGYRNPDVEGLSCNCCGKIIDKVKLGMGCQTIDLDFLGPGYPLFFDYIKYCCFFLIIIILSAGSYSFFSNSQGEGCEAHKTCIKGWVIDYSFVNKTSANDRKLVEIQDILNIFTVFAIIMLLQIFRHQQMVVNQQCDNGDISCGDYTLMLKFIPKNIPPKYKNYKEYIEKSLVSTYQNHTKPEDEEGGGPVRIADINIAYNLSELLQAQEAKRLKVVELQKRLAVFYKSGQWPEEGEEKTEQDLRKKIEELENHTDKIEKELASANIEETKDEFTGIAFVGFETEIMKARVLEENHPNWIEKYIQRKTHTPFTMEYVDEQGEIQLQQISVEQAPEPTDVIWKNLHNSPGELRKRQILGSCMVFFSLLLCFGLIFALAKEQMIYGNKLDQLQKQLDSQQKQQNHTSFRFLEEQYTHHSFAQNQLEKRFLDKHYNSHSFSKVHLMNYHDGEAATDSDSSTTTADTPADSDSSSTTPANTPASSTPTDGEQAAANKQQQEKQQLQDDLKYQTYKVKIIALIIGMTIAVLNKVLVKAMAFITEYQLPFTVTEQNISNATKLSFSMFFNTAIQTFLIKVVIPWSLNGFKAAKAAIISPSGLTINENSIILQNVLITNTLNLVDPARITKWVFQFLANKKKGQQTATQSQLNETFELPEFTINQNYAFIINTMLLTAFYAPLLPIALFYSLICLFLGYWIYKYSLLNQRTVKSALGVQLSQSMTDQLELFLPVFCIGNLIFDTMLANQEAEEDFKDSKFDIIYTWFQMFFHASYYGKIGILVELFINVQGVIVGLIHYFAPTQKINSIIMPLGEDISNDFSYQEAKAENFEGNNYETENPVTKEEAMNALVNKNMQIKKSMKIEMKQQQKADEKSN